MLKVHLSHCKNPDLDGGYWSHMTRPKAMWVKASSLADASDKCRAFISLYELGGGNWSGGDIKHKGIVIARVSYNGRVWDAGADFQIEVTGADLQDTDWN